MNLLFYLHFPEIDWKLNETYREKLVKRNGNIMLSKHVCSYKRQQNIFFSKGGRFDVCRVVALI